MTANLAIAFLTGAFVYQPLVNFGLIPTSAEGMTRQPNQALGYSLAGGMMIAGFGFSAWVLHYLVLGPLKILPIELPVLLLLMWGWHRLLGKLFFGHSLIESQLPLYFLNIAVLGSGLLLIHYTPNDILTALSRTFGISLGFVLSNLLISFFREKAERTSFYGRLKGWPVFLIVCSIFWLSYQGISLLF